MTEYSLKSLDDFPEKIKAGDVVLYKKWGIGVPDNFDNVFGKYAARQLKHSFELSEKVEVDKRKDEL